MVYLVQHTVFNQPAKGRVYLKKLEKEAVSQKNIPIQAFVKKKMVEIYFYQFDTDSIWKAAEQAEKFSKEHDRPKDIFEIRQLLIQRRAYQGEFAKAISIGKEMFKDAKDMKDNYGMAQAAACMGNIYNAMSVADEAIKFYEEGLNLYMKSETQKETFHLDLLYMIMSCSLNNGNFDKALTTSRDLQATIDKNNKKGTTIDLNKYRFLLENGLASIYLHKKDTEKVRVHLSKMDSLSMVYPIAGHDIGLAKARYYVLKGDEKAAYKYFQAAISELKQQGGIEDFQSYIVYSDAAENLIAMNRYQDAAILYKEATNFMTEHFQQDLSTMTAQIRTLYDLDKMEMQVENDRLELDSARSRMLLLLIACVSLVAIIVIIIVYTHRIRKKNIGFVKRIHEQDVQRQNIMHLNEVIGNGRNDVLAAKLKDFVMKNPVYTNPDINRKELANMLATNETYLRNAIKEETGLTFGEYMNELRLDHAKILLEENNGLTIDEIAISSGFGSRSTLHRKFKEKYEISPNEYRKLIKQI